MSRQGQATFVAAIVVVVGLCTLLPASAQSVSSADRQALIALHTSRGGRAADVEALIHIADEAGVKGLPVDPLTNKIREGIAKRHDTKQIEAVVKQLAAALGTADRLVRDLTPGSSPSGRTAALTLLADSLSTGLTPDDIRALDRAMAQTGKPPITAEALSSGAKGLALIKDAKLPVSEGTAVVAEAAHQGYRADDLLDIGREIKRRERDYQTGRATLAALRDAIRRGERPSKLFEMPERPERPERAERPERPARPEVPERPERPERPSRPEVPERPARP